MNPHISIVMAVYNEEKTLAVAVESVLAQTFSDWEMIIVDDGSTDSTPDMLKSFVEEDPRIRVLTNTENMGLAASLNRGIKSARADLIARVDADDINAPDRLDKQYRYMSKHPGTDVLGTGAYLLDSSKQRIKEVLLPGEHRELASLPFLRTKFFHSSVLIRRRFFDRAGWYDASYTRAQDKELWIRGLGAGCQYANLQESLLEYSTNDYVRKWSSIFNQAKSLFRMARKYRIRKGYRMSMMSLIFSVMIKARLYRPTDLRAD